MATVKEHGFTVIELMLFLGVSGALFAALMIGVNNSIGQQRYRESVLNYSTLIQNQFSEVTNTRNERQGDWVCKDDGSVEQQPGSDKTRGEAQPCVILGRAIQVSNNGEVVRTATVTGTESDVAKSQDTVNEISQLQSYKPKLTKFANNTMTLDWQSYLSTADKSRSTASILILRSPASGLLRVFTSSEALPAIPESGGADIVRFISAAAASTPLVNCVQGESGTIPIQSVTVDPRVAGPNGVIVKENDQSCA